jgi:LmbE family N-acetylglucosaminyl deacetylase
MDPYRRYVSELVRLFQEGQALPLGGLPPLGGPRPAAAAPAALLFSPHPDDECIVGGLALRLQREAGMRVVNVAVTQGSNAARRQARWEELTAACGFLGFELAATAPGGLERVNVEARAQDAAHWRGAVGVIAQLLADHRPAVALVPHAADWNSTHIGTHHLVMDALARQDARFACTVVETEFWGALPAPNLLVESSAEDVAALMAALSFHVGEVRRNPYHLRLPAWMMDNVRRGGEVVGGQGEAAPAFTFATLYRVSRWSEGRLEPAYEGGRSLPASTPATLAALA